MELLWETVFGSPPDPLRHHVKHISELPHQRVGRLEHLSIRSHPPSVDICFLEHSQGYALLGCALLFTEEHHHQKREKNGHLRWLLKACCTFFF